MVTQYYTATSVDGFIADQNDSLDWLFQWPGSEVQTERYDRFIGQIGAIAMGSHTYEWILRASLPTEGGGPQPWPYQQPCWVFSTRPHSGVDGADIRFVQGDVAPVHAEMSRVIAESAGPSTSRPNIWLVGGGDLVGQFHDRGLLDEIILGVAPVLLGAGAPLLPRAITTPPLSPVEASTGDGVFVQLTYRIGDTGQHDRPAGRPER